MSVYVTYKPASGRFDNTIPIVSGHGVHINSDFANASETKRYVSDIIEFGASWSLPQPDSKGSLVTTAVGMPPGVDFVDQGSGVLNLVGVPSDTIIPSFSIDVFAKEADQPYKTNTIPSGAGSISTYTTGSQEPLWTKFTVTVTSTHVTSAVDTLDVYVVKNWDGEKNAITAMVNEKYPE